MKKLIFFSILVFVSLKSFCASSIDISTVSSNWLCTNSGVTTSVTTFYGHTNWINVNNPKVTTYTFTRDFYVCKKGDFAIKIKGAMGDNHMQLSVDGPPVLINKDVTTASGFNTPATYSGTKTLNCGKHTITVTVKNHETETGFFVDGSISTRNEDLSNEKCECCCEKKVDARANVTISCSPGSQTINASGMASVSGLGQRWVLKKVNCPTPSNCTWLAG